VYHYDTSKEIGAAKLTGISESGAELVATGCPGCIMQLQDSMNHGNLKLKAVHILELLAQSLEHK
jgi:glycolate oxidase iron-sulfur subunit